MVIEDSDGHRSRQDRLPPRRVPILYFGCAHLGLLLALAMIALHPVEMSGFFYQPRAFAVVHLITLGWISGSILGSLYVVGPLALRTPMPEGRADLLAFALFVVGVAGMAGHFWIGEYAGLAWSSGSAIAGIGIVAARCLPRIARAPIPAAVKAHVVLAFVNVLATGLFGLLLGLDRVAPFMAWEPLDRAYAHAHLAALGWAGMMVIGVGYRLIPMLLPSPMPRGASLLATAVLVQIGAAGLFWCFLARYPLLPVFAIAGAGGLLAFILQIRWMLKRPRRPPAGLRRPDYGVRHALQAIGYAALCAAIGVGLSIWPRTDASLRVAGVYGILGLIGFLARIVVGVEGRILPMFASVRSNLDRGACVPAPDPHRMADRRVEIAAYYGWTLGIPVLATGFLVQAPWLLGTGAVVLLAAAGLGAFNTARILRHAFPRAGRSGSISTVSFPEP